MYDYSVFEESKSQRGKECDCIPFYHEHFFDFFRHTPKQVERLHNEVVRKLYDEMAALRKTHEETKEKFQDEIAGLNKNTDK